LVTVVVPMRNEEHNARRCILSLAAQLYRRLEIVAVDDSSTDGTLSVLRALEREVPSLRVVRCGRKPRGWVGKNYAIARGLECARGEFLLFMDADTAASPGLVGAAVSYALEHGLDLLSLLPQQELGTFWERVVLPMVFAVIGSAFPHDRVNDPTAPEAAACGQFILVRRAPYERLGGHAAVRDKIVEDFELARLFKSRGCSIGLLDGRPLLRVRMYRNLGEIWEGWTKNLFPGIECSWARLVRGLVVVGAGGLLPPVLAAWGVWSALTGGWGLEAAAIGGVGAWMCGLNVAYHGRVLARHGVPRPYVLLFPLSTAVFLVLFAGSAYKVSIRGGVTWKGRLYRAG